MQERKREAAANPWLYIALVVAIYIAAIPIAYVLSNTSFAVSIAKLWPKYNELAQHCSQSVCIYDASFVGVTYIMHILIALIIAMATLAALLRGPNVIISRAVRFVIGSGLIIAFAVHLVVKQFDFETQKYSLYDNSVATSYVGLFRALWPGVVLGMVAVAFYISAKHLSGEANKDIYGSSS
jgi:hypothetical protein